MIEELDVVALRADLPDLGLKKGERGTVVEVLMSREISRHGPPIEGFAPNGLTYHYLASGTGGILMACWDGQGITFYRGHLVAQLTPQ